MSELVWIPSGEFLMGSDQHYHDEGPAQRVWVDGFHIEVKPVTNSEFACFVAETGHVTSAEIAPLAHEYPGARAEDLVPGSLVFRMTPGPVRLDQHYLWWSWTRGANWRHPLGPPSDLTGLEEHPIVHVAYQDALAYAKWAGRDLPTEAEWEYAARGGLDGAEFTWGDDDPQDTSAPRANTWQGSFPYENTELDGWTRTSPVGSYPPNGYGLFDMAGNVWEWTSTRYSDRDPQPDDACCGPDSGLKGAGMNDPPQPASQNLRKVIKGGSHLCAAQYCFRYRPAARQPQMIDSSTSHLGFRCISRQLGPNPRSRLSVRAENI